MMYLPSALPPGGSSTVHTYTQTIHRTTQLTTEHHNSLRSRWFTLTWHVPKILRKNFFWFNVGINVLKAAGFFTYQQVLHSAILRGDDIAFMCFLWLSWRTETFSLYILNGLVFITEEEIVYSAVRTECISKADSLVIQELNTWDWMTSGRNLTPFDYAEMDSPCTQEGDAVRRQKQCVSRAPLSSCLTLNMRHSKIPKAQFVTLPD